MRDLFHQYNSKFNRLKDALQEAIPRSLRLFNIRFRLALDLRVDFKGEVSLTKTREVRDTYALIIRLMEIWNSYEALFHYTKELGRYANPKVGISRVYSMTFLKEVGSLDILKKVLENLKLEYKNQSSFKKDFDQYINRIEQDDRIRPKLTADCTSVLLYFKDKKVISGIELISLIYAERNMYYHNGETAKMGMKYSNRQKLIKLYHECFTEHILRLTIFIFNQEIEENR